MTIRSVLLNQVTYGAHHLVFATHVDFVSNFDKSPCNSLQANESVFAGNSMHIRLTECLAKHILAS